VIISVLNQKGGTGKTTTSIHLAMALGQRGFNTLLLDNDPQGSVGVSLRLEPNRLSDVLLSKSSLASALMAKDSVKVLTGGKDLLEVENRLHLHPEILPSLYREKLADISSTYTIIDMAPSRSQLNRAALFYCDAALIPVACDYLSLVGVRDIIEFIDDVNRERQIPIRIQSILPTMYDSRSRISQESVKMLREHFSHLVAEPIRMTTRAKEAPSHGKTLYEYAKRSSAAVDYINFVDRFLQT